MVVTSAEKKVTSQKTAQILKVAEVVAEGDVTNAVRRGTLQESAQTQRAPVMLREEEVVFVTSVMSPAILPASVQVMEVGAVLAKEVDATSVANLAT